MTQAAGPVLAVRHAQKRFGAVHALKDVSLEAYRGEVLALLGDNGAGKSTLVKCIAGVHTLDEGEILLDGEHVSLRSPAAARRAGVETVYQDLALFDNLTPAQNFYCGREIAFPAWLPRGLRFLNRRAMDRETAAVLDRLKVKLPKLDAPVALMSGGQRQAIAVARATVFARKIVILDEPTAALGLREFAQGARSDWATPRRRQRGHPHHTQHGARRRARRPRSRAASGPRSRAIEADPRQSARVGRHDCRGGGISEYAARSCGGEWIVRFERSYRGRRAMRLRILLSGMALVVAIVGPALAADNLKIGFITKFPVPFYTTMADAAKAYAAAHPGLTSSMDREPQPPISRGRSPSSSPWSPKA